MLAVHAARVQAARWRSRFGTKADTSTPAGAPSARGPCGGRATSTMRSAGSGARASGQACRMRLIRYVPTPEPPTVAMQIRLVGPVTQALPQLVARAERLRMRPAALMLIFLRQAAPHEARVRDGQDGFGHDPHVEGHVGTPDVEN